MGRSEMEKDRKKKRMNPITVQRLSFLPNKINKIRTTSEDKYSIYTTFFGRPRKIRAVFEWSVVQIRVQGEKGQVDRPNSLV